MSLKLAVDLAKSASQEMIGDQSVIQIPNPSRVPSVDVVTNVDWLNAFSSWDGSSFAGPLGIRNLQPLYSARFLFLGFIQGVLYSLTYENLFPTDTAPFVPYSNNHTDWNEPSFRIVTDAENQQAFNKFVTTAIIVVTVAIVATSAVVLIKKLARKRFWKRTEFVSRADNAMWNGESLTPKGKRKYLRAKKKLSVSSALSSGLTASTFSAANTSEPDSGASEVILRTLRG